MKKIITAALFLFASNAAAHEFTPTYPEFSNSFVDGVLVTYMELFNRRTDVEYYELSVFDEEWNPLPFATPDKLLKINYLERRRIELFIRETDKDKVTYICSMSKLLSEDVISSGINSRICSKVK